MAPSVARGSTWKCKSDFQLRSAAVRCILSAGPEIDNGNPGLIAFIPTPKKNSLWCSGGGAGARCAASEHWVKGGDGALELADVVLDACKEEVNFQYLYPFEMKLRDRVEVIGTEVYGTDGVAWTPKAEAKSKMLESNPKYADYATMMVKTHLSLSHDPARSRESRKAGCCRFAMCWCIRERSSSAPVSAPSA